MNSTRTPTIQPTTSIARKEIRPMPRLTLSRVLDASVPVAVVCLALYLGAATTVLGVV